MSKDYKKRRAPRRPRAERQLASRRHPDRTCARPVDRARRGAGTSTRCRVPSSRSEHAAGQSRAAACGEEPQAKAEDEIRRRPPDDKPRFDFYKILPGEQPAPRAGKAGAEGVNPGGQRETFFLQAGAFQNAPDADNLKARLALLGVEATIQTASLPDKGVWHRVRVGPYTSVEELNRTRETLKQNGYDTALVKVQEPDRPPTTIEEIR